MKFKNYIILLALLIIIPIVSSQSNQDSLNWIQTNINWQDDSIHDTVFSISSLNLNSIETNTPSNILLQRQDSQSTEECYPKGNCNVKDTALSLLFLNQIWKDNNKTLTWLASAQTKAPVSGSWLIQIVSSKNGTCVIEHKGKNINHTISIDENNKIQPFNVDWLDIERDLQTSLTNPVEFLSVDCSNLKSSNVLISLLRRSGSEIHIVQQENRDKAILEVNNACYPFSKGGQCDLDSTFLASWALHKTSAKLVTVPYLEDNAQTNLHNAILYQITANPRYETKLSDNVNTDGFWDDVYTTSFVINSLQSRAPNTQLLSNAKSWLDTQKDNSTNRGSFNANLRDTSAATYLVLSGGGSFTPPLDRSTREVLETCGDGTVQTFNDQGISEQCEADNDSLCPGLCNVNTCQCITSQTTTTSSSTSSTSIRDNDGSGGGEDNGDPDDEGGSIFFKVILPILIILIIGAGVFLYLRYAKKPKHKDEDLFGNYSPPKEEKSREQPRREPRKYQPSPRENAIERELDKSLDEAKELFKKK
ncbi:hypothetical protein CL617_04390 [archaeon]|nr:hypothetical protein [archaeon]|tara:strand:+ start:11878 stop:13479 length:1602 start_codon:yes stop_codon:yes gene_type:complete